MEFRDHQFICMVLDQGIKWFAITWTFTFWQWKPVLHNLDYIFPYLNSLYSSRFIHNPSGLGKMQKKNITTSFPDINISPCRWLNNFHIACKTLFAGHLWFVTHKGHNYQCWSNWRAHSIFCNWNEVWVYPS